MQEVTFLEGFTWTQAWTRWWQLNIRISKTELTLVELQSANFFVLCITIWFSFPAKFSESRNKVDKFFLILFFKKLYKFNLFATKISKNVFQIQSYHLGVEETQLDINLYFIQLLTTSYIIKKSLSTVMHELMLMYSICCWKIEFKLL